MYLKTTIFLSIVCLGLNLHKTACVISTFSSLQLLGFNSNKKVSDTHSKLFTLFSALYTTLVKIPVYLKRTKHFQTP